MKRITLFALVLSLCAGLCACNRNKTPNETQAPTVLPTILPTMETNVPDPTVSSHSTRPQEDTGEATRDYTDATDGTTTPSMKPEPRRFTR